MKKNFLYPLFILLMLSAFVAGCSTPDEIVVPTVEDSKPVTAETKPAVVDSNPLIDIKDDVVSASGEVVAGKWANLALMVAAENVNLLVETGDDVNKDDILALIPDDGLPQNVINAQADLILAQKSLDDLLDTDTILAQTVIDLRDAQKAYDDAVDDREELNDLITYKETVIKKQRTPFGTIEIPTIKEYEAYADKTTIAKADENLALKKAILEDTQAELDRLINLNNSPEVKAAQTRITALESLLRQSKLRAPFDGTVVDLYVNSGEMASPGAPVLLLADLNTLQVKTTDLNEVDVARIQLGDPADVFFDALPGITVMGKVSKISLKNAEGSGVYYDVFITLDEIPDQLRWGMSAFVEIHVSK